METLPKATIYDRPPMENPIYSIKLNEIEYFIQRMEGMNPGDTAWYEVEKDERHGGWQMKNAVHPMDAFLLGYTKQEAVCELVKQHSKLNVPEIKLAPSTHQNEPVKKGLTI